MADGVRVLDRGDRHVGLRGIERRRAPERLRKPPLNWCAPWGLPIKPNRTFWLHRLSLPRW